MHKLVHRNIENFVLQNVKLFPAVAILGSRQCGKSTLVKMLANQFPDFLHLDLQNRDDLAKLTEPSLFFKNNADKTLCLDEIQLLPDLFSVLRTEIDRFRKPGRFILLGSASPNLLHHTSETLAGRIGMVDLTPFLLTEIDNTPNFLLNNYWFRGGYPESFLTADDKTSALWRENFIRTYVERDIPQLGFQITSLQMMRLLSMCAHIHGQLLNTSTLGESLGLTHPTIRKYVDILEQTYILRTLQPYFVNTKKRLIKSPKLYFRDSGLLHQVLQIRDFNALMGNPVLGSSWEGLVIENICATIRNAQFSFYRSATGDEMDLVIQKHNKLICVECKASTAPTLTAGFWRSIDFLHPDTTYVVAPIDDQYEIQKGVIVCSLKNIITNLDAIIDSN
ncbi:MAG TPA: ATP-binding protein [Bacteroidales bacterium]|nr:ATP-binding protein [Bacteroidales bacterium]HNW68372.1 ATP-binding protein [Bacteroidales bacterium]HPT52749.1 ATP-binding protein [Bacteroidales bacterium]